MTGQVDEDRLNEWIDEVIRELTERDRAHITLSVVGEALGTAPVGEDGIWPSEPVRAVLQRLDSRELESAMHVRRYNSGSSVRYVGEASVQSDRERADAYRADAEQLSARWPNAARLLRG